MKEGDFNLLLLRGIYQERPPGYQLIRVIGAGAFSQCWLGRHEVSGCLVAVKIISKKAQLAMVEREINFWRSLDHPNIVQLYEVIPLQNNIYVAMEYVSDGELFMLLAKHEKGLEMQHAISLFTQICQAVSHCHSCGIGHRDIKLENIFLCDNATTAKLGDFSFAVRLESGGLCKEWLGSPEYSPPEMLKNQSYDPCKTDSWSLGVVLFALLTGYLPFSEIEDEYIGGADLEKRVCQRVINGRVEIPKKLTPTVREVLLGLLQYDPRERWSVTRVLEHIAIRHFIRQPAGEISLEDVLANIDKDDLLGVVERAKDRYPDAAFAFYQILIRNKGQKMVEGGGGFGASGRACELVESSSARAAFDPMGYEQKFANMRPKRWLEAFIPTWANFKKYNAVGRRSKSDSCPSSPPPDLGNSNR